MTAPPLVLLTEDRYERPAHVDWYVGNILQEDALLAEALAKRGIATERVSWSRPDFDWSLPRAVVVRSTWDYFDRYPEFSAWLNRIEPLAALINPIRQLRWNADKHYLADLQKAGVAIPPTRFIEPGESAALTDVLAECGWSEAVLKPAVSGAARHTYRITPQSAAAHEDVFRRLLLDESWMLQPFLKNVMEEGEISLMVFDGRCTHAVRKRAKAGDFRVQDDHGGTVRPHNASREEIEFAERAVRACEPLPAYARVDLVRDDDGRLVVMELELIEPELFLRFHPPAADAFAEAIMERI
ncbi:MAG: hypothetical protein IT428_26085 [Planctomycetaceae bacterium]|nr:hypothetical protein [Planctomycetaceae bacterium]